MGRKKKEFSKDGTFQKRFRDLYNEKRTTQKELAIALAVSRPTIAGWLDGKNIPDIVSLAQLAQFFNVSADYLLGLSDLMSPDVNCRAAAEYTGLSEAAVEWLHIGLDDSTLKYTGVGLSDEKKKKNWDAASSLIKDRSFSEMIFHLKMVSEEAYREQILAILCEQYTNFERFEEPPRIRYSPEENRDIVETNFTNILTAREPWEADEIRRRVAELDDLKLSLEAYKERFLTKDRNELHQFQAAKAFNRYMDQMVNESFKKAEQLLIQPEL